MHWLCAAFCVETMPTATASVYADVSAQSIIERLRLLPNPEKRYYRQTFEDAITVNNQHCSTAIYYLLEAHVGASYWHRVTDAVEVWHYYARALLRL